MKRILLSVKIPKPKQSQNIVGQLVLFVLIAWIDCLD